MSKQTFYEKKGDNITWKKGDIYNDGSTILMVERIEERGVDVNVCLARKALCFFTLYPCLWCCLCPPLCYARHNNEVSFFFLFFFCFFSVFFLFFFCFFSVFFVILM